MWLSIKSKLRLYAVAVAPRRGRLVVEPDRQYAAVRDLRDHHLGRAVGGAEGSAQRSQDPGRYAAGGPAGRGVSRLAPLDRAFRHLGSADEPDVAHQLVPALAAGAQLGTALVLDEPRPDDRGARRLLLLDPPGDA